MKTVWNTESMSVSVDEKGFSIYAGGECYFELTPQTSVSTEKEDIDNENISFSTQEKTDSFTAIWKTSSNLWNEKLYKIEIRDGYLLYTVAVKGEGVLEYTEFFNNGVFYDASGYFSPDMKIQGKINEYHNMDFSSSVGMSIFAPTVTAFAFDMEDNVTLVGAGIAPMPGEYNFDKFDYNFKGGKFTFGCDFKGYTRVKGEYTLPGVLFVTGTDEYTTLKNYSGWMYKNGGCNRVKPVAPKWWYGPFFCGWGDQWIAAKDSQGVDWGDEAAGGTTVSFGAKDAANEVEYNKMINALEEKNIDYSMVIIDDKWQKEYGTLEVDTDKWPDLRGYIESMHRKGKRVTLWYNLWGCEGLDEDECILIDGKPAGLDPTSPKYVKRLEKAIYKLLSDDEGCCNADGFKLDFANILPMVKGMKIHKEGIFGIELLKANIANIFRIAKSVKPDALITHTDVHPYFGEITDMIRLHDYYAQSNKGKSNMEKRCLVARAAFGEDLMIDTDAPGGFRRRDAMQCVRYQPAFGVPVLYGIKLYSFFTDSDWEEVRKIYSDYSRKIDVDKK